MEIRLVTNLSGAEKRQLFEWGPDVFGGDALKLHWRPAHWHFLVYADGLLVSHVGVVKQAVTVGIQQVTVGGIGGVVTVPAAQGKGYASAALQQATKFMCEELKVEFGMLFCLPRMIPFYQRFGWQEVREPVLIQQPSEKIPSPLVVMAFPCRSQAWPAGQVELESLPW
jgi:RimJ/RimL family protein N-acetyltransferase